MIVALVFAQVWGVVQIGMLGSLTRTTRPRTVLLAMAVGLYAAAPLAIALQMLWTRPAAWMTGVPLATIVTVAGYTIDPLIEEVVKVLPVAGLLLIPVIRRQWTLTDCVLIGAAVGSGFGAAEALYRYGTASRVAHPGPDGWLLTTSLALPFVPSVWTTLTSWLPPGVSSSAFYVPGDPTRPWTNVHLAYSALGGLGVGLLLLTHSVRGRATAMVILLYIWGDHAAWNAAYAHGSWAQALLTHRSARCVGCCRSCRSRQ